MEKLFAKIGNWPFYVVLNGKTRGPVRTSLVGIEDDIKVLGEECVVKGMLSSDARPLIEADRRARNFVAADRE